MESKLLQRVIETEPLKCPYAVDEEAENLENSS